MSTFLFLGANTAWVYALAEALAHRFPVRVVRNYDWLNYRRLHPRWPSAPPPALLERTLKVFPPGYVGPLEPGFRGVLQRQVDVWCRELTDAGQCWPWVVAPYPYLAPWVRDAPAERLIYYNLDDYVLYNPAREEQILAWEDELIERAALTICLAAKQVESLRARHPSRADRIRHFPLGVVERFLNPHPEAAPQSGTVGYVGNLVDRVDWRLVGETARALPGVEFVFVGGLDDAGGGSGRPGWEKERAAALALPNVRRIGPVPQEDVPAHYWAFGVNWIPYVADHPFNRASCPTKIMDSLATGRPVISTDVPECRLYPDWIAVACDVGEMVAELSRRLAVSSEAAEATRATRQVAFAKSQTWDHRAETLVGLLPEG